MEIKFLVYLHRQLSSSKISVNDCYPVIVLSNSMIIIDLPLLISPTNMFKQLAS